MCGVAGLWTGRSEPADGIENRATRMARALAHRGPDDAGTWIDTKQGLALSHRRLSIIDLSSAGRQPMTSQCGRYVVSFNGEIYNFSALREQLRDDGLDFATRTDTEVILQAVARWGFAAALTRLSGMFALALWDRRDHRLHLARDRVGKKPMYYYRVPGLLLFGSELKALCAHPGFPRQIDPEALHLYLRYHYVPAPRAIFAHTCKLRPGEHVTIEADPGGGPGSMVSQTYWDPLDVAPATASTSDIPEHDQIDAIDELLQSAVQSRMVADVPLGSLLSGGIDSATVTAMMQRCSARPVRTFTIGFNETTHNEATHARAVADHLGTDHTELYVTPDDALEVIPQLPGIYDEPFGDCSQIPTILVSRLARESVTVALAGDGGDELFGGYDRYTWAEQIWRWVGWAPDSVRHAAASGLRCLTPEAWDRLMTMAGPLVPGRLRMRLYGDKAHKLAGILEHGSRDSVYRHLVAFWDRPGEILEPAAGATDTADPVMRLQRRISADLGISDFVFQMMLLDMKTYLPEDILVKVDRASMASSLEVRAPLLDHRLIEAACALPPEMRIRDGCTKWLLRQVLYRYVPQHLVDRPKSGFGVPIGGWLRGPLKDWAEDLLDEDALRRDGIFQPQMIRRYWGEHLGRGRDWKYHLWGLLMFQAWKREWNAWL